MQGHDAKSPLQLWGALRASLKKIEVFPSEYSSTHISIRIHTAGWLQESLIGLIDGQRALIVAEPSLDRLECIKGIMHAVQDHQGQYRFGPRTTEKTDPFEYQVREFLRVIPDPKYKGFSNVVRLVLLPTGVPPLVLHNEKFCRAASMTRRR